MSDAANGHPRDLLSAYIDDELGYEERAAIDLHLAGCEECREEIDALRRLKRAIADEAVPPMPVDLEARIGRRLDDARIVRSRKWRFVVPATIAASVGAIGILVAVQWREGRLAMPLPTEPKSEIEVADRISPANVPSPSVAPQEEAAPRQERVASRRDAFERDTQQVVEPNAEGVPGGVVGGAPGSVSADDGARQRATPNAAIDPALMQPAPAAGTEARPPCGERWSDSGVRGAWVVQDLRTAVEELDQIARDLGGVGLSRGVVDGRPYVLVVPRGRFEEVFLRLRDCGVVGLLEPRILTQGSGCSGLSIVLTVVVPSTTPSPR